MSQKARLITPHSISPIFEPSNNLVMRKLIQSEFDGPDISVTLVEIVGGHRKLKTDSSTRIYYILEGSFNFSFEDYEDILATTGEVLVIYRSSVYGFTGKGKYLVMNGPAFQDGDDIYLEEGASEK